MITNESNRNKKKVLVEHALLTFLTFFLESSNVVLNLGNQRRHGNERAAQRLGFQDAAQLVRLRTVNARVLRRMRQLFFHPRAAAHHLLVERVLPHGLVLGVAHDLIAHCSELRKGGRRHHVNVNLNGLNSRIGPLGPPGVGGGTVSGSGL